MAQCGGITVAGDVTIAGGGGGNRDDVHPAVASRNVSAARNLIWSGLRLRSSAPAGATRSGARLHYAPLPLPRRASLRRVGSDRARQNSASTLYVYLGFQVGMIRFINWSNSGTVNSVSPCAGL